MWRYSKKALSLLLALVLVAGMLPERTHAAEQTLTPNQNMLEAMLSGNRQWVIETLVDGNWENNPMAIVRGARNTPSLAKDALDYYGNINEETSTVQNVIYQTMVGAMYAGDNIEESILHLLTTVGEAFLTQSDAKTLARDLDLTRSKAGYDSLLKSVFTASYTASDGTTLVEREASLTTIDGLQKAVQYCSSLTSLLEKALKEEYPYDKDEEKDEEEQEKHNLTFTTKYVHKYLTPLGDAAAETLDNCSKLADGDTKDCMELTQKALGSILVLADLLSVCPDAEDLENPDFAKDAKLYQRVLTEHLEAAGIPDMLKNTGTVLDIADTALENYIFLEKVRSQRQTLMGPLSRLSTSVTTDINPTLHDALAHFVSLLEGEYSKAYGGFTDGVAYLRANRFAEKTAGAAMKHIMKTEYKLVEEQMSTKVITGAVQVLAISSWISDQAIGLKGICNKTFELLRWEELTDKAVNLYRADLQRYQSAQSEDTARVVLEDLLLLQRLRLYGEKTAYALGTASDGSWYQLLDTVLNNNTTAEKTMETIYQRNIDILMAANAVPLLAGLTVNAGEEMYITYRDNVAGYVGHCGDVYYVELPLRLAAGISGGGQVYIDASPYGLGTGSIQVGSLHVINGELTASELEQSGGVLELRGEGAHLTCTDLLKLGSPAIQSDTGPVTLTTKDLELNGTVNCTVEASGDADGRGTLTGLTLNAPSGEQALSGTFIAERLRFTTINSVTVSGSVTASGSVYGPSARIINGKNILLSGGTVEGSKWNGDLSVQNAALNGVYVNGSLYDSGGSAYAGTVEIHDVLDCAGTSSVGAGSALSVYGAAVLKKPLEGTGQLNISGDLSTASGITIAPELNFTGTAPQEISGAFTAGTVRFAKTDSTVTVRDTVTVTGRLENPAGTVKTLTPVYLGDDAVLSGNFTGSLSLLNQNLGADKAIGGDLTLREGGKLTGTKTAVAGRLILAGAGTVDGCGMTVGGLTSPTSLTLQNGGAVTVRGDASLGGKLENPAELPVLGDLTLSGLTSSGPLRVRGDVIVSGATALNALTLDGSLAQQITGSNFTVGDLNIHNTSGKALKLAQTITVTGRYDNPSTRIQGGSIQGGLGAPEEGVTEKTVINGGLVQDAPLVVTSTELVIYGPVSVPNITLVNAQLTVSGNLTLTGSSSSIDSGSKLTVRGELRATSGTLTLDGAADVRGDLLLGKATLTGGNLTLGGDLYGAGLETERLTLNGLVRQRIVADSMRTRDLTLANTSMGGVILANPLHYTGALERGETILFQESNLVKEAS